MIEIDLLERCAYLLGTMSANKTFNDKKVIKKIAMKYLCKNVTLVL